MRLSYLKLLKCSSMYLNGETGIRLDTACLRFVRNKKYVIEVYIHFPYYQEYVLRKVQNERRMDVDFSKTAFLKQKIQNCVISFVKYKILLPFLFENRALKGKISSCEIWCQF